MNMDTEPARIIGLLTTLVGAVIPIVAVSLGWTDQLAEQWQQAIVAVIPIVIIYGGFELTRAKVVSPATNRKDVEAALHDDSLR
jgi:type IV secretory pathway VirB2 component (pilin)